MQVHSDSDVAVLRDRLVAEALPAGRGFAAWLAFLRAHAALMRRLATDLAQETGLTLGDFDVLAQLVNAGGELRMTDLAARAFSSRSNMTRRIDRLVEEGLVCRRADDADARGVMVALTERGLARFAETAPVHLRGIAELFVAKLDDEELAVLERALGRVCPDASFG
jgi:DNA-binding MarR family transcriptional regulator